MSALGRPKREFPHGGTAPGQGAKGANMSALSCPKREFPHGGTAPARAPRGHA
jgi:hypothetical protein